MRKVIISLLLPLCLAGFAFSAGAQTMTWSRTLMDGSRTGVTAAEADNVEQALGKMKGRKYIAPNGRVFRRGCTPKVAKIMLSVQPVMADVKRSVAYCPEGMVREYPESGLSNMIVDDMMRYVERHYGKKVDFGLTNFGGIRVDMPKGNVLVDDVLSMLPFRNKLCYLTIKGKDIRALLEQLAATRWQVVGGARCVVEDGKLVSAEIGGEPLDDDKVYGVVTSSFLLAGGDGIFVAKNALSLDEYDDLPSDVMMEHLVELTAKGLPVEYPTDGRIVIRKTGGE